jgi:hypothetical protein
MKSFRKAVQDLLVIGFLSQNQLGERGGALAEALHYYPDGRGFDGVMGIFYRQ